MSYFEEEIDIKKFAADLMSLTQYDIEQLTKELREHCWKDFDTNDVRVEPNVLASWAVLATVNEPDSTKADTNLKIAEWFKKYKISLSKMFVYVLVQKDLVSADRRVQALYNMGKQINIYCQAERNELLGIRPNKMQLEFAQRYVYGRSYKKETWEEYKQRNNFKE